MGFIELIVINLILVAGALAAVGYFAWKRRQRALPPPPTGALDEPEAAPELPPEPAPEPERAPAPEGKPGPGFVFEPPKVGPPPEPTTPVPLPQDKPRPKAEPLGDKEARRREQKQRYQEGLAKTRGGFVAKLARILRSKPRVDADLRDQVEEVLFTSDIGSHTAEKLLARVTEILDKREVADPDAVWSVIRQASLEILDVQGSPPDYDPEVKPYVLLMIGVNGVGKTTTLGKLAAHHVSAGRKVLLVAGDTFRAAAVEQLDVWARRVGCDLHAGADKADPSSVIFEGIVRGRRQGYDIVLCDTAGRLHTRKELMDELGKVRRACAKAIASGVREEKRGEIQNPHDTYLVLDATIGQNALAQAQMFKETMDFTGLVVTKLDGTAKGGVVLGICDELKIPIRYVGIGERVEDLRPFSAEDFADALYLDQGRTDQVEKVHG